MIPKYRKPAGRLLAIFEKALEIGNGGIPGVEVWRQVLEEHLRDWCKNSGCTPSKAKPTLNDYNDELYRAKKYNVSVMKHVAAMVAIGNDAAHNTQDLDKADVKRLLGNVREFMAKHSATVA